MKMRHTQLHRIYRYSGIMLMLLFFNSMLAAQNARATPYMEIIHGSPPGRRLADSTC